MNEIKLDKLDLRLLFELDTDSRQSIQKLAGKLRTSRDVVSYRIRKLEQMRVIEGYYTLIDVSKLGYLLCRLYLKLKGTTQEIEDQIIHYLVAEKTTFLVYRTQGAWDIATGFMVPSAWEFDRKWRQMQEKFQPYLAEYSVSTIYELISHDRKYLAAGKYANYSGKSTGNEKRIEIKETELQLLKLMARNARILLLDIAKKLGVTPATAKAMIKRLEKEKVILAYKAIIDFNKLGYRYYKIDLYLEYGNKRAAIQEFAMQHINVVYEDRTIGGSDLEFDLEVRNEQELYDFVEEIKKQFPGVVRSFHYYHAIKSYKTSYMPE